MTTPKNGVSAERAERILAELTQLALTVRDEGVDAIGEQLDRLQQVARGDLRAALVIAAALIDPDRAVDPWWQYGPTATSQAHLRVRGTRAGAGWHRGLGEQPCQPCRDAELAYFRGRNDLRLGDDRPRRRPLAPCGTHSAFARHGRRGETPDAACIAGERKYQRERMRDARAQARSGREDAA